MTAKDVIRSTMTTYLAILKNLLADLSDADLLDRPAPAANHIAWQLGHLIAAEARLVSMITGNPPAELPAGFAEKHAKEAAPVNEPAAFQTKAAYLELFDRVRESTLTTLDAYPDADLDKPNTGRLGKFFPTMGAMWMLAATHPTQHMGQVSVVRRMLGKPILV